MDARGESIDFGSAVTEDHEVVGYHSSGALPLPAKAKTKAQGPRVRHQGCLGAA